jgi:phosphatidylglycerol lysyltransferase
VLNQNQRSHGGLRLTAGLTALMGLIDLLSAISPSLHERVHWLEKFYPFEVRSQAHLFSAILGFFLLTLATNLLRRKRVAWRLTLGLVILSILSHLVKGFDWEEALFGGLVLGQLLFTRKQFTANSDRPAITQGVRVLCGAMLFTLAYGTAGFYWMDHHYQVDFDFVDAMVQTLAMFFTEDNAGLVPRTRYAQFFADSIYAIGATTTLYALWLLLLPVFNRGTNRSDRNRAQALVERWGQSALAWFALLPDKSYYFSPSGQTVIAYVAKGRVAVALGDPIGPLEDLSEALRDFELFCDRNDWQPAFYQTLAEHLDLYRDLGYRTLQIGEEAIVDLKTFTLKGKANNSLRNSINKFQKQGYRLAIYEPPLTSALLKSLRTISDDWLRSVQGAEKRFSVGWFSEEIVGCCTVAVLEAGDGRAIAFVTLVPEYQRNEANIDLMRHRNDAPPGTMDFLFLSLLQHCQQQNFDSFNLGLVALSGVGEGPQSSKLERGIHYLYNHLNGFYNFQGLRSYKEKYHPSWEPRYLVYPRLMSLPDVVVGLVRVDSGDRLLDYFKPGN